MFTWKIIEVVANFVRYVHVSLSHVPLLVSSCAPHCMPALPLAIRNSIVNPKHFLRFENIFDFWPWELESLSLHIIDICACGVGLFCVCVGLCMCERVEVNCSFFLILSFVVLLCYFIGNISTPLLNETSNNNERKKTNGWFEAIE